MIHPQLVIFGASEAAMFLRRTPNSDLAGIISIHGSHEYGVASDIQHRLDLTFDDTEVAVVDDIMSTLRARSRERWARENGLTETAPTVDDAAAIVKFAETMRGANGILLCHCGGGMSRAPAVAVICLSVWLGEGSESECVTQVRSLRRGAIPHVGLVRFADHVLGRNGALVRGLIISDL